MGLFFLGGPGFRIFDIWMLMLDFCAGIVNPDLLDIVGGLKMMEHI